jgi:Leucine-rich repeat (LRR) protein
LEKYSTNFNWWKSLSQQWRQAFGVSVLRHENTPSETELEILMNLQVLRLAGPSAPFPNCSIELTDLSGLSAMSKLETVIITHHKIEAIEELAALSQLKSLFLFNNQIKSLKGIEGSYNLEQLYVQCNRIETIKEVEALLNLKELYISDNNIASLNGLTEAHSDNLKRFVCLPNDQLKQKEIIRAERELGIICR